MKKSWYIVMLILLAFALMIVAGCSGASDVDEVSDDSADTESEVEENAVDEGEEIEEAEESAWIVTIVGSDGGETQVSIQSIMAMASVDLEAEQKGEMFTFHGVLLSSVLAEAGITEANSLNIIASDGYSATITGEVAFSGNTILAYASNGETLSNDEKNGPLRLVTTEESPQVWVGQLTTIEVE